MKRFVKGLCLIAVVALVATSCKKKEDNAIVYRGGTETFETEMAPGLDRIYIDDTYRVLFEAGDFVTLFNISDSNPSESEAAVYKVVAEGYEADFEPNQPGVEISDEIKDAKYAFYPGIGNVDVDDLANENRATFKLDIVQNYREVGGKAVIGKNALYMAAKLDNPANNYYAFRNICGVLVMKFYSPSGKAVKSIKLTDKAVTLTGDVTLKVNKVDPAQMQTLFRNYDMNDPSYVAQLNEYKNEVGYAVDHSGKELTLSFEEFGNKTLGTTAADASTFYFVLRPLALMQGFDMEITFSDNTTKTISTTRDNKIKPNTLRMFPALSVD